MLDFFHTLLEETDYAGSQVVADVFAVFTGVELLPWGKGAKLGNQNGNGKRRFRMITHKSKLCSSDGNTMIEVFV